MGKRVYFSVLNMGLGHAARSLPIIQDFLRRKWRILIGSNGRACHFLKRELPSADFIETPDYQIRYFKSRFLLPGLSLQIPRILESILAEHRLCESIVATYSPDLIISDHCYGAYHDRVPSVFLSHQTCFAMPYFLRWFHFIPFRFNRYFHRRYSRVVIPDVAGRNSGLLSGGLSRVPADNSHYRYIGILSGLKRKELTENIDIVISISGPEPQRSLFEKKILDQAGGVDKKIVVLLGKSEQAISEKKSDNLTIYSHLPTRVRETIFNRTKIIVTRPGYTTLMELAELGKKALVVPTPGQTEQISLAKRSVRNKWFYTVEQHSFNLVRDVNIALTYSGLFLPNATDATLKTLQSIIEEL